MRINSNINAMNAYRQMTLNTQKMEGAMQRVNSGYKINSARDGAAELSISEKMRSQIRGMSVASDNAQNGQLLIRTAEGQLGSIGEILQKMRDLTVRAADDSNEDVDRTAIQEELNQLSTEISRIAKDAEHNNIKLLDGSFSDKNFQIGANRGQSLKVSIGEMSASVLGVANATNATTAKDSTGAEITLANESTGLDAGEYEVVDLSSSAVYTGHSFGLKNSNGDIVALAEDATNGSIALDAAVKWVDVDDTSTTVLEHDASVSIDVGSKFVAIGEEALDGSSTSEAANLALDKIDDAIKSVSTERSKLGAIDNRLTHTIKNLDLTSENLIAAESRIRDADVAKEMMEFMKYSVLQQSSMAMLAQANMQPQSVLRLLG